MPLILMETVEAQLPWGGVCNVADKYTEIHGAGEKNEPSLYFHIVFSEPAQTDSSDVHFSLCSVLNLTSCPVGGVTITSVSPEDRRYASLPFPNSDRLHFTALKLFSPLSFYFDCSSNRS